MVEWSEREREYVRRLWDGLSQKEAAVECGLTLIQANHLLRRLKTRCRVVSTIVLLRLAVREGMLQP
jgi:DNA-binding CsgD family transcriptional regulator